MPIKMIILTLQNQKGLIIRRFTQCHSYLTIKYEKKVPFKTEHCPYWKLLSFSWLAPRKTVSSSGKPKRTLRYTSQLKNKNKCEKLCTWRQLAQQISAVSRCKTWSGGTPKFKWWVLTHHGWQDLVQTENVFELAVTIKSLVLRNWYYSRARKLS